MRDWSTDILNAIVMVLAGLALIVGAFVLIWKAIWRRLEAR